MTKRTSAGLLMFRRLPQLEVLLAHPGGPFWVRKDEGAWSIPKGEIDEGEKPLAAARREFLEETGIEARGAFLELGTARQPSSKIVHGFAFEGDCDPATIKSNSFEMEWPPKSGRLQSFPEVDRAEWFALAPARVKINKGQAVFLDRLEDILQARKP